MQPLPGDRVVVRYRLGAGGPDDWRAASGSNPSFTRAPSLSDITGFLRSSDTAALSIERDGVLEQVPVAAITAIRQLSARTVRNTEVRAVERRLTDAVGAAETATLDGWTVLHSPDSSAVRANAAVPLEFGANAGALEKIRAWYTERGSTPRVIVPERLLRSAEFPGPAQEYEVLTNNDEVVEVSGGDLDERMRLRESGFGLHHTFLMIELAAG
ncbi:MAG: GCN5 family acetyltransferase [Gordonia sp. (in: high G+C Gram-positive bacteria)]|uniref:GNAT family N-acetyltransferase, cg3035/Rv0428c family n=1 Tax=Gordonia sp. (in: high G+C Gram-positive bacteria) TaxID=84139 RepID=UPI003BB55F0C